MAEEAPSPAELQANLQEYEEQLEQVGALLLDDPHNQEYKTIYDDLSEVIQLTRELVAEAGQSEAVAPASSAAARTRAEASTSAPDTPRLGHLVPDAGASAGAMHHAATVTTAPDLRLPSILPPAMARQILLARQRAALAGQAPAEWAIGAAVRALYRGDGQWYAGTVSAVSAAGKMIVAYDGYEQPEELEREEVQLRGLDSEGGYTGVSAPKRRKTADDAVLEDMPAWLSIKPDDDEATKTKKKRLQKSYKSKQRFAKMDLETKEKANAWKSFVTGKGAKKKKGFMTGHKKGSMFAAPQGLEGRVGVVGSGKAMTEYTHARRHVFDQHEAED